LLHSSIRLAGGDAFGAGCSFRDTGHGVQQQRRWRSCLRVIDEMQRGIAQQM